jgi:hypothetical protein
MSIHTLFYLNKAGANNNYYYYLSDILKMSDHKLQIDEIYFDWVCPDINKINLDLFIKNKDIRKNVLKVILKLLNFYGYEILSGGKVQQIKPLKRFEKGIIVGLYSEKHYKRLVKLMIFLNLINMEKVSSLIMLAICQAMNKDKELRKKIEDSGELINLIKTQKYLKSYLQNFNMKKVCSFTGLKYKGNSCYQDSVLLALFAKPNDFITVNILQNDVKTISSKANREIKCGETLSSDYRRRVAIQNELIRITKSMRRELDYPENVEYCSNLRALLRNCPSSSRQEFHGTGTQDAGEFLQYIFALFKVEGTFRNTKTIVTNDLSSKPKTSLIVNETVQQISPIILVPAHLLRKTTIDTYLKQKEDAVFDEDNLYKGPNNKLYRRRIETNNIVFSNYLVFYVQRLLSEDERIYEKIVPLQSIKLDEMRHELELNAIVVHRSNHYTCYIKCNEDWFYYNDMSDKIKLIGSFEDMLNEKSKPNVCKEGVLYFYN